MGSHIIQLSSKFKDTSVVNTKRWNSIAGRLYAAPKFKAARASLSYLFPDELFSFNFIRQNEGSWTKHLAKCCDFKPSMISGSLIARYCMDYTSNNMRAILMTSFLWKTARNQLSKVVSLPLTQWGDVPSVKMMIVYAALFTKLKEKKVLHTSNLVSLLLCGLEPLWQMYSAYQSSFKFDGQMNHIRSGQSERVQHTDI